MILWLTLAAMTVAAVIAVLWPLARRAGAASSGSDVAVYRDQLDEVDRDLKAGLIGKSEAEAARVEISRRLIAAADDAKSALPADEATSGARRRRAVALAAVLLIPLGAGGLYLWLGSPELASAQAIAQRGTAGPPQSIANLIAQAEAHLERNPNDGNGWEVLAPVYMRLDRYSDAVTAWRNALRLLGESAERDANLGEALMAEANGIVTAEAKAAFVRAMTLDETLVTARYYLGLAAEQDGQPEKAARIWRDLLTQAPEGAPWIKTVRDSLARAETQPGAASRMQVGDVRDALSAVAGASAAAPSAPSATQMAAAAQEPPEQQAATIKSMVERLAVRLKEDGSDPDGWVRLVRAYKVLGDAEKARSAAADARHALAGDADKLQRLDAALKELETTNAETPAPGPSAAQVADAANPPEHQAADINGMVERLAARLKQDGSNVEGWVQLVRSYKVLGQAEKARAAAADARQAIAGDADKLEKLESALKELDTTSPAAIQATPVPATGPKAAQAASDAAPADHAQGASMDSMVERLAERLKKSGSNPEGWLMLVRSYTALGAKDKATAAIADARQALADNPERLEQFNQALKHFNIAE
ncbi:MAG TPA: c-type cytochrome biogenesis protein CcmI [Xanthobacteraceae bacterium]|nr:c-type cytochrome biogenesis protein CcmI [Xanthobacteraceae bacterium]